MEKIENFLNPNSWIPINATGDIPLPRSGHCCAAYNDDMYIFGGYIDNDALNDMYKFSIKDNVK